MKRTTANNGGGGGEEKKCGTKRNERKEEERGAHVCVSYESSMLIRADDPIRKHAHRSSGGAEEFSSLVREV